LLPSIFIAFSGCIGNSNQLFLKALTVPPDRDAISDQFARCFVKIPLLIRFIDRCVDPLKPTLRIRLLGRQAAAAPVSAAARGQANPDA